MHDIFGADVIDIFDMKFKPDEHKVVKQKQAVEESDKESES